MGSCRKEGGGERRWGEGGSEGRVMERVREGRCGSDGGDEGGWR